MICDQKVDLGSIQIHKKVIADIAAAALSEIEGVTLSLRSWRNRLMEFVGRKNWQVLMSKSIKTARCPWNSKCIFVMGSISLIWLSKFRRLSVGLWRKPRTSISKPSMSLSKGLSKL